MTSPVSPSEQKVCPTCGATYGVTARFCPIDGMALAAPNVDNDPLVGQKLDGRYLVLRKIGTGGMGAVYEAVQLSIDRPVAIKIIRDVIADSARERQRFWLEARAVSRLEHGNVVRVYDYGSDQQKNPFLVMELLRGRSLTEHIRDNGLPMNPQLAAHICADVCKGLAAAHASGLVHRDIKPSNIWLGETAQPDQLPIVKILDFGLVKGGEVSIHELTTGGEAVGTPSYMSPEQVEGRHTITGTADLYSVGVVFFELLVGHVPYGGSTVTDTLMAHLTQDIPCPSTNTAGHVIPSEIQVIWQRALAKKPSDRFGTAREMMYALQAVAAGAAPLTADTAQIVGASEALLDSMHAPTETQIQAPPSAHTSVSSRSLLSRERKLVTVVTVRAADRPGRARADLEERLETLDPYIAEWTETVALAGGVVNPVEGQGIHAVFGLPTASEEDSRHALRTAIALSQKGVAISEDFAIQVGVHTCSVLVQGRDDTVGGFRIVGEAYEVAESVAAAGPAGGGLPVLSGPAYRGLQRYLRQSLEPAGEVQGDPYYVVPHDDVLASRELSLDIHKPKFFVGRDTELSTLEAWVDATVTTRCSGFAHVLGEAGVGKSHLLVALGRRIAERWPDMQFMMAAHDGHGQVPFSLFRAMLLGATGPSAGNAAASISRWVTTVLSSHATNFDQGKANDLLRLVGLVQGDDGEDANPEGWRQRVFGIVADLCGSLATRGGLVLLVDDLHDTDAGSIELLQHITRTLSDFPVLVVGFGRPDGAVPEEATHELVLGPLDDEGARALAVDLLGEGRAVAGLTDRILDRADGNPLFIEELAKAAGDLRLSGELPASLHALLQARYDSLPGPTRLALQQAAVVGRTFWTATVDAQRSDEDRAAQPTVMQLESLLRAGLIEGQDRSLYAGQETWRFSQNLMQEVAYASALRKDRRSGHGAVADWILAQEGDPPPAHYPLLATQLEGAGRSAEAARAWLRAANDARDRYANQAAANAYGKALALQQDWPDTERLHAMFNYGSSLEAIGQLEKAVTAFREVSANTRADATDRTLSLLHEGRGAGLSGRLDEQLELLKQALKLSREAVVSARLRVSADYAYALSRREGQHEAERIVSEALTSVDKSEENPSMCVALANLHLVQGILHRNRGELVLSGEAMRRAIGLFERTDNPRGKATTLVSLVVLLRDIERYSEAATYAQEAAQLFGEGHHEGYQRTALLNLAWCHVEAGEFLKAKRVLRRVRDLTGENLPRIQQILLDGGDALAALGLEQLEVALENATSCMALIEGSEPSDDRGWALYAAGKIRGDVDLLKQSADCWRQLERPAWLARTLDVLIDLGVDDSELVAERDRARSTLAAARAQMEDGTV